MFDLRRRFSKMAALKYGRNMHDKKLKSAENLPEVVTNPDWNVVHEYAMKHVIRTQDEYRDLVNIPTLNRLIILDNLYEISVTTCVMETKHLSFEWLFAAVMRLRASKKAVALQLVGKAKRKRMREEILKAAGNAGYIAPETERFVEKSHMISLARYCTEKEDLFILGQIHNREAGKV